MPSTAGGPDVREVYLHPGQLVASAEPMVVTTILGSCVAVCLWDPETGVGGMNHFLLPEWLSGDPQSPRFAVGACEALLDRTVALGAWRAGLVAKVFGGSWAFAPAGDGALGGRNVKAAMSLLHEWGIPVAAEDVGGRAGRKVVYETASGAAWVRTLGDAS
jgi:chemotaxis protein CheD